MYWFQMMYNFYLDTAGSFDAITKENKGFYKRYEVVKNQGTVVSDIRLPCELYQTPKLLVPGTPLSILLTRIPNEVAIMCAADKPMKVSSFFCFFLVRLKTK